jgi:TPR repeat protein
VSSDTATWAGSATRIQGAAHGGPRGSCVRLLSLLAYELLGGPRTRVESTGQYTPIAALTQEGNVALRRALVDECPSARELAGQLAAAVGVKGPAASASASARPFTPEPLPRTLPPKTEVPIKHKPKISAWVWVLAISAIALLGIVGSYTIYRSLHPGTVPQVALGNLAVESDPTGAAVSLDEGAPIKAPYTFNNVKFGSHRLTANLKGYQPIQQDLRFDATTPSKIILKLQQSPPEEITALSIQSEPAGAAILLDGKPPQAPSNTFTHVPFGTHQLSATLDDYEPIKQDIEVRRGMTPQIRLQLKPTQEIAALSIQSEPAGASILLDGKPPQAPSNAFTHVPFGTHQLSATLDDYEPIKQDVEVRRGMTPEIRLQLKPTAIGALLSEIKKYDEGSPQYLNTYVRLVQLAPSSGEHTKELGRSIEVLRKKTPPISKDEFDLYYKSAIKDAANLNILPAMLWLAENENGSDALDWFLRAAKLGDSYAMMTAGRLYLRKGTPNDDFEGFRWLNRAYDAPKRNLEAGAYIADCYLSGKGTKQDVQKAEDIIMPLANQNVVPAMTLAGRIFEYKADLKRTEAGTNTNPQIQKKLEAQANDLDRQARQWWERAEKDDWNASAHLAQYYEEGWGGIEKSAEEAEKRYKAGADHGNALSTFLYGLMLAKKPSRHSEAEKLISRAASMGLPSAIKWCRENNVPVAEIKAED